MRRVIVVMLVGALLLDVAYRAIWFTSRDTLASEHREAYYAFENAFPLADFWLGVAVLFALFSLTLLWFAWTRRDAWTAGEPT
jgi:hypothetical protein